MLEGANIKLGDVVSNVLGKSGREMLDALVGGSAEVAELAQLARGRMREKIPQLEKALRGHFADHQRFLIARQLVHIDQLDGLIGEVSEEISARPSPLTPPPTAPAAPSAGTDASAPASPDEPETEAAATEAQVSAPVPTRAVLERLTTIPGLGQRTAEVLVAEIGADMTRFPTAQHLAAWAGMAPGNNESAGRRRSGKTRKGSAWLRSALTEAAQAASHTKNTYLVAQYRRLAARRWKKKAIIAVGHTILVIAFHLLRRGTTYQKLGGNYFDDRDRSALAQRLIGRLKRLGIQVSVENSAGAATAVA